jgi:hypothetical protein
MPKASNKKSSSVKALFEDIADELDDENFEKMTPADRMIEGVAREILRLERDMTIPGSSLSEAARVERLSKFIEERGF